MKKFLLALSLLVVAGCGQPRYRAGVRVGPSYGYNNRGYLSPPPRAPGNAYYPASPGRGFVWVDGYYYPNGNSWQWRNGSWLRPPNARARWNAPRYNNGRYYDGYWR